MNDIFLEHHGVKGMKWGVRKDRVFVSGSSKISNSKDPHFRRKLPSAVEQQLDKLIKRKECVKYE